MPYLPTSSGQQVESDLRSFGNPDSIKMRPALGGPSHGVRGLIEISDKLARLSEAGHAFETKRRELEHQFEVTNSELREEYLAAVLEIHAFEANGSQHAHHS
ncbi:MAG TPA: hypothetical protein VN890_01680 [Methylocella sp.]|nr:hypothetical protein [Methylocella sp.]